MSNHLRSGRGPKRCPTGSGAGKPIWRRCARTRRRQFGRKTGIFDDRIDRPMSPRVISVFFFKFPRVFFRAKFDISFVSNIYRRTKYEQGSRYELRHIQHNQMQRSYRDPLYACRTIRHKGDKGFSISKAVPRRHGSC